MAIPAKYVHTNLIAEDWKRLSQFYIDVFGCKPVPPERDLHGDWLEAATGVRNVRLQGTHLRLPGYGDEGPTLEIFQYSQTLEGQVRGVNRPGFAHVAFAVEDVEAACQAVLDHGGGPVGEMVQVEIPSAGRIHFAYVADPEGNVIELQQWQKNQA